MLMVENERLKMQYAEIDTVDKFLELCYKEALERGSSLEAREENYWNIYRFITQQYYQEEEVKNYFTSKYKTQRQIDLDYMFGTPFSELPNFAIDSSGNFLFDIKNRSRFFCKAYMSVIPERYIEVVDKLVPILTRMQREHNDSIGQCKFRLNPGADSIVLRFSDEIHLNEFLQILELHPDIKECLGNSSLFLPCINGLMLVPDRGGTYNGFVATIINDYIYDCIDKKKEVSIGDLYDYIDEYNTFNIELKRLCTRRESQIFKTILGGKIIGITDEEILASVFDKGEDYSRVITKKYVLSPCEEKGE